MTERERVDLMIWFTLCVTILLGTGAIAVYGPAVNYKVSLAVAAQWGALLAVARERMKGDSK